MMIHSSRSIGLSRRGAGTTMTIKLGKWLTIGMIALLCLFVLFHLRLTGMISRSFRNPINIYDDLPLQQQSWQTNHNKQALYSKLPKSSMWYIPEALRSKGTSFNTTVMNSPFMPLSDISFVVQEYIQGMRNGFKELSRLIYQSALENNQILLTLQIGGMDGISNDPMHQIFVLDDLLRLHHWFPIVVEPVPTNFDQLTLNYADIQEKRGMPGTAIRQYAITSERDSGACEFCHWNTSSMDQRCLDAPDWIRTQLGTLDCPHLEHMMGEESSRLCIAHDELPCGTVLELMNSLGLGEEEMVKKDDGATRSSGGGNIAPIGIVQIDVEGFEVFILQSLMNEFSDETLPLVLHFEKKVMVDQDIKNHAGRTVNGTKIATTFGLLRERGYVMYDDGEDVTAIRLYQSLPHMAAGL